MAPLSPKQPTVILSPRSIVVKDYNFSKPEFFYYCIICICGRVMVCLTVLLLIKRIYTDNKPHWVSQLSLVIKVFSPFVATTTDGRSKVIFILRAPDSRSAAQSVAPWILSHSERHSIGIPDVLVIIV